MDDPKIIGERVRRLREARGLTQLQLANAASMTSANISRLENGLQLPRANTALALARALGVEPQDLVGSIQKVEATQLDRIERRIAAIEEALAELSRALGSDAGELVVSIPQPPAPLRQSHQPSN